MNTKHCGYAAIVGRPNVGKSTLLNHLLGHKLSITSRRPQTTRHNILGIKTEGEYQMLYVDTPGINDRQGRAMGRYLNRAALTAMRDVDVILFVVDRDIWTSADAAVAEQVRRARVPVVVVLNKVDRLADPDALLPRLAELSALFPAAEYLPISALNGRNLERLEALVRAHMPIGAFCFPEDQYTDRSERFLVAEIVREKITRQLGAELPYSTTVEIEEFRDEERICHISALILVERDGQKKIIIGDGGQRIKKIGEQARQDIQSLLGKQVMLRLWVKVKSGWSDDERALRSLGYRDGT
jgi:GTP-binding protein Era